MLNDLSIGADTSKAFGEFVRTNADAKANLGKMEFSVQVSQISAAFDIHFCTETDGFCANMHIPWCCCLISIPYCIILSSPFSSFPLLFSPLLFSLLCPAQVLTTGNWPTYKVMDLNLPPVMQRCVQFFQQYYTMEVRTDITDIYMMATTQTESLHPTVTILSITQYDFLIHRVKALHTRDSSGPTHWAMQW